MIMAKMKPSFQRIARLAGATLLVAWLPAASPGAPPLMARFSTDRPSPYAGEAFLLTLKLYISGGTLDKRVAMEELPPAEDILLREFEELPTEEATVEGTRYEVRPFRTWARAVRPGAFTLTTRLQGTWVQSTRSFFFIQESRRPATIIPEAFQLRVRALPTAGRPPAFSGLVGSFRFTANASPLDIAPGDLITVTLSVEGDWIPESLRLPRYSSVPGLRVYELKPQPEESSLVKQVCQQTVVPQDEGALTLPPLELPVFDTATGTYKTLKAGPFPVSFHGEKSLATPIYTPDPRPPHPPGTVAPPASIPVPSPAPPLWKRCWNWITGIREAVVLGDSDAVARLAPAESARELFRLKPGTVVQLESSQPGWYRIVVPEGVGWLPAERVQAP